MVGGTRSTPGGFYQGEGSGTNGDQEPQGPPPPPPPPLNPTLAQVFAAQNEILRQLAQGQQQLAQGQQQFQQYQQQQGGRRHQPAQEAGYQDFLATQPPVFIPSEEPLDADAWIKTIESKFALISAPCAESNKALFAAQQLRGAAKLWWDGHIATYPA